ncbi:MAG: Fe-S cluster protein, partial [Deltaproteobacteria bacterium]
MPRINNPMEIFKLLNGSNCRECGEKTCLAFAVAVFKDKKPITACPHLPAEVIARYGGETEKPNTIDEDKAEAVEALKRKIPFIDLAETARRLGAL